MSADFFFISISCFHLILRFCEEENNNEHFNRFGMHQISKRWFFFLSFGSGRFSMLVFHCLCSFHLLPVPLFFFVLVIIIIILFVAFDFGFRYTNQTQQVCVQIFFDFIFLFCYTCVCMCLCLLAFFWQLLLFRPEKCGTNRVRVQLISSTSLYTSLR